MKNPNYEKWPLIARDPLCFYDGYLGEFDKCPQELQSVFRNRAVGNYDCIAAIMTCDRPKQYLNHTLYSLQQHGVEPIILRDTQNVGPVDAFRQAIGVLRQIVPKEKSVMILQDDCWIKRNLIEIMMDQRSILPCAAPHLLSCYRTTPAEVDPEIQYAITSYRNLGNIHYSKDIASDRYNGGVAIMLNQAAIEMIHRMRSEMLDYGSIPYQLGRLCEKHGISHMQTVENQVYHLGRISSIKYRPPMPVDCMMDDLVETFDRMVSIERKKSGIQYTY